MISQEKQQELLRILEKFHARVIKKTYKHGHAFSSEELNDVVMFILK
jgi:predicted esterase